MAISPDEKDCEIDFNWDDCRIFMKDQIQSLAEQRYFSMLKERGKIGDGGDPDYMTCFPPPPPPPPPRKKPLVRTHELEYDRKYG